MTSPTTPRAGGRVPASWRRLALAGLVLPLVAATVLVWATTGRPQNLDRVPVAVVNDDEIIQEPQPMAAGRALAAALTEPTSQDTYLDWTLANDDDAQDGLRSGAYYAVLTIPPDFSKAILSTGTDAPVQGGLTLVSNAAASTTVPFISQAVASAAATALGEQATQAYLGQVYDGFNQLASSTKDADTSSQQLASGTDQVAQGADQLATGADRLSTGLDELAGGAAELAAGTGRLVVGADDLAAGARELAAGSRRLDTGAEELAHSAGILASGERDLRRGALGVAAGADDLALATRGLAAANRLLARDVARLAESCEQAGASASFCRRLDRAGRGAGLLARGSVRVRDLAGRVATGADLVAAGTADLAAGSERLAAGARSLDAAAGRVASGAGGVSSGAASLARGVGETDTGASDLAAGASSSASGGVDLASGATQLSAGAASADDGAHQLSQGLAKLAAGSPTYTKSQQQALTTVVSQPVTLTSTVQHSDDGNGWLLGLVLGVVLWLAALLGVLRRDIAAVVRHAGTPISSWRLTGVQLWPATGLALVQGAAALVALPLLGVEVVSPVALAALSLLAAVTFTLVGVALRWAFGGAGIIVFVLFLLLQAAALGNVLPIETAPAPLPQVHAALPLPAYVDGASQLASGGAVGSFPGVVTVLVVWTLASSMVALLAVRHRRVTPTPPVVQPAPA